ncbi:Acyl-coenzyme A thioesterase 13 isoform D [Glycine soja]|uniref:Acyl-coenzyme A thioesterase 13 isoform C n=1 Tax=Glycine soja TaxID=3848 RepID=A0A445L2T0_GLYSO|nr:Acyl-coenzyme A thioesterase 13 isoform C [Glycine soja]RZC17509.1 Acyl-coenzyme A thioesterase 13 isoform D [Glycine soja]
MDLEAVKRYLEKGGETASAVDGLPPRFLEPLIMNALKVDLIETGRVVCSMKIPPRLLNAGNSLHGGAIAALVDVVGSAAIPTVGYSAPNTGVSVEINVSYLDAAYADVSRLLSLVIRCLWLVMQIIHVSGVNFIS